MPKTPDDIEGGITDAGKVIYRDEGLTADAEGETVYRGGHFQLKDSEGVFDPRTGGGISAEQHKTLRQLIHFLDDGPGEGFASGAYHEILPSGDPFPTSETWWESAAKLKRIVDLTITRNANKTPATEAWRMYDTDGSTVLATVTDTIAYSGVFETSRTRTIA